MELATLEYAVAGDYRVGKTVGGRTGFLRAILIALIVLLAVEVQVGFLNGPGYWQWNYRRLDAFVFYGWAIVPLVLVAGSQFVGKRVGILLLCLGTMGFQICFLGNEPNHHASVKPGQSDLLVRLNYIVNDPSETGYQTDMMRTLGRGMPIRTFLTDYPNLMIGFHVHPFNKPPAGIFYYYVMRLLFGEGSGFWAAMGIAVLASLGVPATYWLMRGLSLGEREAMAGAGYMACSAGLLVFLPKFDQIFPIFTPLIVLPWMMALRRRKRRWACLLGVSLFLVTLMTYNLLTLGVFMVGLAGLEIWLRGQKVWRVLEDGIVAVATTGVLYAGSWWMTGYDPVNTFVAAWVGQQKLLPLIDRVWPRTIGWDLISFGLSFGWAALMPAVDGVMGAREKWKRGMLVLGLMQPVVIAVSGIMQAETTRLWVFMIPFVLMAAGVEMARWTPRQRAGYLVMIGLISTAIFRNMGFTNWP